MAADGAPSTPIVIAERSVSSLSRFTTASLPGVKSPIIAGTKRPSTGRQGTYSPNGTRRIVAWADGMNAVVIPFVVSSGRADDQVTARLLGERVESLPNHEVVFVKQRERRFGPDDNV